MQSANEMRDRLVREFAESYMEKLFYFCLRKTGDYSEAEDLTQDIALHILSSLNRGTIPSSFSAWVWQIARNRYCVWATEKHKRRELVSSCDIGEYEIEDGSESVLEKMIRTEQTALLRRELSLIRSDYRDIIVAYYIENRSVRAIAAALSLSENTVKQRLFRARKILKEGMDMAREFGVRSYKPEEINYINNCSTPGKKDQPYSIFEHKLYQNILLEAYGNPSSAEALSLELGVALPYMEDELEYLTRETVLCKEGDKYQTAFPIVSREAQQAIHTAHLTAAPDITKALADFVGALNETFAKDGYAYFGTYQDYESAKWSLLMLAYDHFLYKAPRTRGRTERLDGGKWDVTGYQHCDVAEPNFVGNHGSDCGFQQFKYMFAGIADRTPNYLTDEEAKLLRDYAEGKASDKSSVLTAKLAEYGYLSNTAKGYEPTVLVLHLGEIRERVKSFDKDVLAKLEACAETAAEKLKDLYRALEEIILRDLPNLFLEDEYQRRLVISNCYHMRGYVMAEALRQGYLLLSEELSPAVGAHFYLDEMIP